MSRSTRARAQSSQSSRNEAPPAQTVAAETSSVTSEDAQELGASTKPKTDQFLQQEERSFLQSKYKKPVSTLLNKWRSTSNVKKTTTKEALVEGEALITLLAGWEKEIPTLVKDEEHQKTQLQVLEQMRNSATDNDQLHKFINLTISDELSRMSMEQGLEFHDNAWTMVDKEELRNPWSAIVVEEMFRAEKVKLSNGRNEQEELFANILHVFQDIMSYTDPEDIIERINRFIAPLRETESKMLMNLDHSWGNRIIDLIISKTEDERPTYGRSALIMTLTKERSGARSYERTTSTNTRLPEKDKTTDWWKVMRELKTQTVFDKNVIDQFNACGMQLTSNKRQNENNSTIAEPATKRVKNGVNRDKNEENKSGDSKKKKKEYGRNEEEKKQRFEMKLPNPLPENLCHGCGSNHTGECNMKDHPDYNKSQKPFHLSDIGKKSIQQETPFYRVWKIKGDNTEYRLPCLSVKYRVGEKTKVELEEEIKKLLKARSAESKEKNK